MRALLYVLKMPLDQKEVLFSSLVEINVLHYHDTDFSKK